MISCETAVNVDLSLIEPAFYLQLAFPFVPILLCCTCDDETRGGAFRAEAVARIQRMFTLGGEDDLGRSVPGHHYN